MSAVYLSVGPGGFRHFRLLGIFLRSVIVGKNLRSPSWLEDVWSLFCPTQSPLSNHPGRCYPLVGKLKNWERVFIVKVYAVLTVALSVFCSVLTCVVYNSVNETQAVSSASSESGMRDLVQRLDSIQARLDSLATTVDGLPRQETSPAVAAGPGGDESSAERGKRKSSTGTPSPDPAASTGERLAALLELKGGEQDVRQYVTGIIEDDRRFQKNLQPEADRAA